MNITVPDNLSSLAPWYAAGMFAMFSLGLTFGIAYSRGKLRDAVVIARIVARYQPEAAAELGVHLNPQPSRVRIWLQRQWAVAARSCAGIAIALLHAALTPTPPTSAPTAEVEPKPRARDRFTRQPGEFPLLHANPLVPLLTSPKMPTVPAARFADRMFLIITRNGRYTAAAFLPA